MRSSADVENTPPAAAPEPRRYEMERFGLARWPEALRLLLQEYPQTQARWWQAGLERLRAVPPNDEDLPIGLLMHGPRGLAGVMLLIASRRAAEPADWLRINGSSWAIEPPARPQVLRMAQASLMPQTIITSLTATPAALRVQQRVGFTAISHQRVMVVTPRLAWRRPDPTHAEPPRVLGAGATLEALSAAPIGRALADHQRLGAVICGIEAAGQVSPLVWWPRKRSRFVPCLELIYTESVEQLGSAIAPLCRHLLGLGFPLLEFEAHEEAVFDFPCTRLFRRRFAKGPYRTSGVDHLYSEFVYLQHG